MGKKKISAKTSPSVSSTFPSLFAAQQVTPYRICAQCQERNREKHGVSPHSLNGIRDHGPRCQSLAIKLLCNLCQVKHSASVSSLGNSKFCISNSVVSTVWEATWALTYRILHRGLHRFAVCPLPSKLWIFSFTAAPSFQLLGATHVSQKHNTPCAPCSCVSKSCILRH